MRDELLRYFQENGADATRIIKGGDARMVRSAGRFGIFVPANVSSAYFEDKLNSMTMRTGKIGSQNGVLISCKDVELAEPFADECARFLSSENLTKIKANPFGWWNEIKSLFGNVLEDENHYFVFAEFLVYLYLHVQCQEAGRGLSVKWKSCAATHDIEMSDGSQHEVKSTIKRSSSTITISSKFQMSIDPSTPFFIYFLRLEPDRQDGCSIQDLIERASAVGCDMGSVEQILSAQGITAGSPKRKTRFAVLEGKRFDAGTGPFPKLTPESFKPECANLLAAVENFSYDVNLSALTCPRMDVLDAVKKILGS